MTAGTVYLSRAGRAGTDENLVRSPELSPLRNKTVAVFGTGCLGAPSVLEFARAGIGELWILDRDIVDPGTIGRWPLGLSAAGLQKVKVLSGFIASNYPLTKVCPVPYHLGLPRAGGSEGPADQDTLHDMTAGASLIYDATTEIGVQHFLSELARELSIPYLAVVGSHGGWGGKVLRILPGRTKGCWMCYRHALADGTISEPPSDPNGEVQPVGCGDVTFTGAGFDMLQVALTAVRIAVSTLCSDADGAYPPADLDVMTMAFRDEAGGLIAPKFEAFDLQKHPQCTRCNGL